MRRRPAIAVLCCLLAVAPALAAGSTATGPTVAGSTPAGHIAPEPTALDATAPAPTTPDDPNACIGTMTKPADGITVVSVQGMRFGDDGGKRQAQLVALGPEGEIEWVHRRDDVTWSYDVDPRPDGTLFVTATGNFDDDDRGETVFYKLNASSGEIVWEETVDLLDTHDADLLDDERILVANMRANEGVDGNQDRLLVYNRTTDEITWEWQFRDHFEDRSVGGNFTEDWSHVNDVDAVNDTHYLASPRNFDMVVMVNRTSGDVEWTLGEPNSGEKILKQHNPVYMESENGTPTVLVADSENDRIVEYERQEGNWTRTWRVGNRSSMDWPRDADRLPDGNTLVGDSANDRVIEVTPDGEVVWEVYTPWLVYDVERVQYGDEAGGPTIADQNATGAVALHGDERRNKSQIESCADALDNATKLSDRRSDDGGGVGDIVGGVLDDDEGDSTSGGVDQVVRNDDGTIDPLRVLAVLATLSLVVVGGVVAYRRRAGGD